MDERDQDGSAAARDRRFREEAAQVDLRFRCGDCLHRVSATGDCSFGYPNAELMDPTTPVGVPGRWIFCKYFELG